MKKNTINNAAFIGTVLIILAAGYGWIMNLVILFNMTVIMSGEGVLRILGVIIPPLGSILGYV